MTKTAIFANSRWRTAAILKIVFGYISAPYCPINAIFGTETKDHMPIYVTLPKLHFREFKMADGRHFENSFISISQPWIFRFRSNLVHVYKFPFRAWTFEKNRNFSNLRWRTDGILKIVFWLYLGAVLADLC